MAMPEFGILTFAFGAERYRSQAVALAQSIKLFHPDFDLACITDHLDDEQLKKWFNYLIPFKPEYGKALQQKLHFDLYTPYKRTAFIDSDCFVCGNLSSLLDECKGRDFAVLGIKETTGWWYMDIEKVLAKYRIPFVPHFNGGYYYFEKTELSASIFKKARQIGRIHHRIGIYELKGWFNEEVFYALSLAVHRIEPLNDNTKTGMFTPDEFTDPFYIDTLSGRCRFVRNGQLHQPRIVHFFGATTKSYHYLREKAKLNWHVAKKWPKWLCYGMESGVLDPLYATFVFLYMLTCKLRGIKFPYVTYKPNIPLTNFGTKYMEKLFN